MADNINQNGNSAAPSKEENPAETDSSFDEYFAKLEAKSTPEKIEVGVEFYKRIGFYCAFNEQPQEEFRRALLNLNELINAEIENLKKECTSDLSRFASRKQEANDKAAEIKTILSNYEGEISKLEAELPNLRASLEELQESIKRTVIEIGSKKETLIQDRQEALLEELNRLNQELEVVVKNRMAINEDIFLKQKDILGEKRKFWQKLFAECEKEHGEVLDKLNLYGLSGYHYISSRFLYHIGLISAGGAGAFFAFFAEINLFASGGVLSFIIQALFTFSTQFVGQNLNVSFLEPISKKLVYAGVLLIIFLLLLVLVFLVSWACHTVYQKMFENRLYDNDKKTSVLTGKSEENYAFEMNLESKDIPIKARMFEKTFLGFWISTIPALLFLAIGFLLVSLGTDVGNLKSLDASIAGYGVGVVIALASAGILYIYLTMIIEGRIEKRIKKANEAGRGNISWLWLNLELFLSVLAFISSILIILIFFQHPFNGIFQTQSVASLILFMACSLLTAFTLGFGIRFQSLEMARELLEMRGDIIQTKIIRISRPMQIYLTEKENNQFNYKFIQVRDEIMNLMLSRTRATRNAINTPVVKENKTTEKGKIFSNLNNWFKSKLHVKDKNSDDNKNDLTDSGSELETEIFTASKEIRLCFPKLEAELSALEAKSKEVQDKISSTEKKIIYRKEQKGAFYEKKLTELERHEKSARNYHKEITNRERYFHHKENIQKQRKKFLSQKITEGYELGSWFAKHSPTGTTIPKIP